VPVSATADGKELFGRLARVTLAVPVATAGDFGGTTFNQIQINSSDDPVAPGLRIQFSVNKSEEKEPNTSTVTITNLSPSTRGQVQQKGVKLILEAGYKATGLSRIFIGDVRTADHVRKGADWESVLRVGDGERSFRFARCNESFAPGTSSADVLRYLAGQMGISLGNVPAKLASFTTTFDHGYSVFGPAQGALDTLIKSLGFTWSIQDGNLQVLAPGETLDLPIPEIGPDSGLVDSPEMGTPEKKGKPALCKFKCLLLPTKPAAKVRLKSLRYDGQLRVKKCNFDGDTDGKAWHTTIEGTILGQ
jgi:hypothetical protein